MRTSSRSLAWCLALWPAALCAKTYDAIPKESELAYVIVHPMHVVHGVNNHFACQVDMPDYPPSDPSQTRIRVSADVTGFDSGNSSRDSHAMEVVEAIKYPKVEFTSTSVAAQDSGYLVTGKLRFHGREREVQFPMRGTLDGRKLTMAGDMHVLLSNFEVPRPALLFVPVKDSMTIRIKVALNLDQAEAGK